MEEPSWYVEVEVHVGERGKQTPNIHISYQYQSLYLTKHLNLALIRSLSHDERHET